MDSAVGLVVCFLDNFLYLRGLDYTVVDCDDGLTPLVPCVDL